MKDSVFKLYLGALPISIAEKSSTSKGQVLGIEAPTSPEAMANTFTIDQ
jgi:hypothetical protein